MAFDVTVDIAAATLPLLEDVKRGEIVIDCDGDAVLRTDNGYVALTIGGESNYTSYDEGDYGPEDKPIIARIGTLNISKV
jgi:hypothetical protein